MLLYENLRVNSVCSRELLIWPFLMSGFIGVLLMLLYTALLVAIRAKAVCIEVF
jgi:hypothetical protein